MTHNPAEALREAAPRPKAFTMLADSRLEPKAVKGSMVYAITGHDYGLASDDTRLTGVKHMSVTLNADGSYPFFTVPESSLEPTP